MLSKTQTCRLLGIVGDKVEVEVDISNGMPLFQIVGLTDSIIQESKERVKLAIKNSGFEFPYQRLVVNLSPANIRKEGSSFDLPIAIAILKSMGEISTEKNYLDDLLFGELTLSGELIKSPGCINAIIFAKKQGIKNVIIPYDNHLEAQLIKGINIILAKTIEDVVNYYNAGQVIDLPEVQQANPIECGEREYDFKHVKGQERAKRALLISAAGGHNVLMMGSPGAGKTLLSKSLTTILPDMTEEEIIECTQIFSSVGLIQDSYVITRPFRNPHHTSSNIALIGGGHRPMAGEISLAHNGVLFLDELTEFPKTVLEVLREPLEDKVIHISRANYRVSYPANFTLIAASNPCLCGNLYEEGEGVRCTCSSGDIDRYQRKLSGPLLDRIDLFIAIRRVETNEYFSTKSAQSSAEIKEIIMTTRTVQNKRFKSAKTNALMSSQEIKKYCALNSELQEMIKKAMDNLGLTARGVSKILKISRTIADIEGKKNIEKAHLLEALSYRKQH